MPKLHGKGEQLDTIIEQKQFVENKLKQLLGNNEVGTIGGNIVSWKSVWIRKP